MDLLLYSMNIIDKEEENSNEDSETPQKIQVEGQV